MKGQGALEYLMTYGWALLIIVVVGSALYSLGILNPSTYTQSTCTGFQYFQYRDQVLTTGVTGTYSIEVLNGNRDIEVTSLVVDNANLTMSWKNITAGSSSVLSGTGPATNKASGEPFAVNVQINYSVIGGISGNTDSSTCTGRVA